MTTHARLSPSGSKQWMTCPGSIGLIERLGRKDKTNKYAAEGSVAHWVHEQCLLKSVVAETFLGQTRTEDGFTFTINENMVEAVQESLDYIYGRIKEAEDFGYEVEMLVEVRSSLKFLEIPGLDGGTADVILIFRIDGIVAEIEIIDYKHGQGVSVEVEHNTQALCYALGIIYLPEFNGYGIHEGVRITISQPRSHHPDGRIRHWDTTKDEIRNWEEDDLIPAAKETLKDNAALVPSDEGCRFCLAAPCSALDVKTQEIAMLDFADEPLVPELGVMSVERKKLIMKHANMIRSFIVSVEAQVQHEVDNGSKEYEDEYKLVRKTTHRKFTEEALDVDFSPLLDHLAHGDLFKEVSNPLGEIEKKLKKKLGAKDAKKVLDTITIKPKGSLVIAPIADKRKAVEPSLISDFDDLD